MAAEIIAWRCFSITATDLTAILSEVSTGDCNKSYNYNKIMNIST